MEHKLHILDGGFGTMLQGEGLPVGMNPVLWNLSHPDKVTAVHKRYADAGSDMIITNTFGANRSKLAGDAEVTQVIAAGVRAAKASGEHIQVALDVGPLGQLLEPLGTLPFEEAYAQFREVVTAGEQAGADLIFIETMSDLYEVKAAVLAAKENTGLPVFVCMTFEENGRTFLGTTVPSMALTLEGLGVDAIGFNCSMGPEQLLPLVAELRQWTTLPLILKPNAGLPDPITGSYQLSVAEFVTGIESAVDLGVTYIGGCCGTTPAYIKALSERFQDRLATPYQGAIRHGVCAAGTVAEYGHLNVIGERINPTGKKRFQQALREHDMDYILSCAVAQQDAGAQILDVNVGLPGIDEAAMMEQVVKAVQSVCELPLQIDASDPAVIEAGLRAVNGKAIVNSVNADPDVLQSILPLCKKYGAAVVGLTMDRHGLPTTWQERVTYAKTIIDACLSYGIPKEDILIDCLTMTVSTQPEQARQTLLAVQKVREMGVHAVLGVSNISFGLPERSVLTVTFLTQALQAGLDFAIVNPNIAGIMDTVCAYRVLSGEDAQCTAYVERFAGREVSRPTEKMTITDAIALGLKAETAARTKELLLDHSPLEVVDLYLIPALDEVGKQYEQQTLFLPQLMRAANAACAGFEVIKTQLANNGEAAVSHGKILLATVQGDIHDIGKNIVRVVLENYGYTVLDLGRDVPPELIVQTAIKENIRLIGLSALMTTTVRSMELTIQALRDSGHPCKVMVGGAVLTPEYAEKIGADFYAKDAKCSADIARSVLG